MVSSVLVVSMMLALNGCAVQSLLIDTEPERAGFVITKPPVQISYRGDVTPEAQEFALRVLESVKKVPYRNYRFNENVNVRLNSIDAKTDKADINLHETTQSNPSPLRELKESGGE
jgi:hypothetical protein